MALKYEKPDRDLLDELQQVSVAGQKLLEELGKANRLPEDFPHLALSDMVEGLAGLKNGTAEGCRAPLENAHKELRAIRFDHFISEQTAGLLGDLPDKLRREEPIDTALQRFKGAIESALECYSRQAQENIDDSLPLAAKADNPQTASTEAAIASSAKADEAIKHDIDMAEELVSPDSNAGGNFVAVLHDALNLNRYGRGLLQLPELSREWLKPVVDQTKKYKSIIHATGRAVTWTAGRIRRIAEFYDKFKKNPGASTIEAMENIGRAMQKYGLKEPPPVDPEVQKAAEEQAERLLRKNLPVPDEIAVLVANRVGRFW